MGNLQTFIATSEISSPRMILILDGEELVGAKQNRIVNTTILIQDNATIVVPVSCVEHGRWSYDSPIFHSQKRMMSSNLRAMKSEQVNYSIRSSGEYRTDQGAIWDGIAEKSARMGAPSPTGAMAAMYDKERPTIDEYVKPFNLIDSQVCFALQAGMKSAHCLTLVGIL